MAYFYHFGDDSDNFTFYHIYIVLKLDFGIFIQQDKSQENIFNWGGNLHLPLYNVERGYIAGFLKLQEKSQIFIELIVNEKSQLR